MRPLVPLLSATSQRVRLALNVVLAEVSSAMADFSQLRMNPHMALQSLAHGYPVTVEDWLGICDRIEPPLLRRHTRKGSTGCSIRRPNAGAGHALMT